MLPFIVGAVALGLLSRGSRDSNPNQLIIELDTALPAPEVEQVIGAIRVATPATVAQLDAMSNGVPPARHAARRPTSWRVARGTCVAGRGRPRSRRIPTQAPRRGSDDVASGGLPRRGRRSGDVPGRDGRSLTETNPDKLHAFAETLRSSFPQAAEALDSKAVVFGWQAARRRGARNG